MNGVGVETPLTGTGRRAKAGGESGAGIRRGGSGNSLSFRVATRARAALLDAFGRDVVAAGGEGLDEVGALVGV
ncbi:MAG TPA: hypothetical protein QGH10_27585, partial [Armatimonadota bacterium]|nr:hypothetical protein [Armatimonadota bacterium]